jgi:two-component system, sporulation sensor kinase E
MATTLLEREKTVELQTARLEEQNRLLRDVGSLNENILKSIESILIVSDLLGIIKAANPIAADFSEREVTDLVGTPLFSIPAIRSALANEAELFDKVREDGEAFRLDPRAFGDRFYSGYLLPLKDHHDISGVILVLDDVTEWMEVENRLKHAENLAAVGRMTAQVAHEVRNPLHAIGLEVEGISETLESGNEISPRDRKLLLESLDSIQKSVERLEAMTENYLRLSRLSSGKREAIDPEIGLSRMIETYRPQTDAAQIEITADLKGKGIPIEVDPVLFEQWLGNLHRNAIEAVTSSGRSPRKIQWQLKALESGRLFISVEDTGIGIPEKLKDQIFDPFVTSKAQGTGLGLSFVKQGIEEHGGEIRFETLEHGTRFEIFFPIPERARHVGGPVESLQS